MIVDTTYTANRNANGMLLLLPESAIIAEVTNGPMNAEVLPTCQAVSTQEWLAREQKGGANDALQRKGQRRGTCRDACDENISGNAAAK